MSFMIFMKIPKNSSYGFVMFSNVKMVDLIIDECPNWFYFIFRFILCNSEDIYSSLDIDCDDSASEALELQNQKKKELLKEIDFSKFVTTYKLKNL